MGRCMRWNVNVATSRKVMHIQRNVHGPEASLSSCRSRIRDPAWDHGNSWELGRRRAVREYGARLGHARSH